MNTIEGHYFDGLQPVAQPASLVFAEHEVRLNAETISESYPVSQLKVSPRVGQADRFIYLPDGKQFQCADQEFLESLAGESRSEGPVAWLEGRWGVALAGVVIIAAVLLIGYFYGLPAAAEQVASRIPVQTEQELGRQVLRWMDKNDWVKPTGLDADRQKSIRAGFEVLCTGLPTKNFLKLELRNATFFGPNAFALPGGTIVLTDDLVNFADSPEEIVAVLAHEIGHVELRHTLRIILQNSIVGVATTAITSDAASLSVAIASFPMLVAQTKYSREFETEADEYAFRLLKQKGYSPAAFASLMEKFVKKYGKGDNMYSFISTHPITTERIKRAYASAGVSARDASQKIDMQKPAPPAPPSTEDSSGPTSTSSVKDMRNAQALSEEGWRLLTESRSKENLNRAERLFEKANTIDIHNADAYAGRGRVIQSRGYISTFRYRKEACQAAMPYFEKAASSNQTSNRVLYVKAEAHLCLEEYNSAIRDANILAERDFSSCLPHLLKSRAHRGIFMQKKNRSDEELAIMEAADHLECTQNENDRNGDPIATTNLFDAIHLTKNYDSTVTRFKKNLQLKPDSEWSYRNYIWILKQRNSYGDLDELERTIKKGIAVRKLDTSDLMWVYHQRGKRLLAKKDYRRALSAYGKFIDIHPNYYNAVKNDMNQICSQVDVRRCIKIQQGVIRAYLERGDCDSASQNVTTFSSTHPRSFDSFKDAVTRCQSNKKEVDKSSLKIGEVRK